MTGKLDGEKESERENEAGKTEEQESDASADDGDRIHGIRPQIQPGKSGAEHSSVDQIEDSHALRLNAVVIIGATPTSGVCRRADSAAPTAAGAAICGRIAETEAPRGGGRGVGI